jgi:hypothetical protein
VQGEWLMRAVFLGYLLVIWVGLAYFLAIAIRHG